MPIRTPAAFARAALAAFAAAVAVTALGCAAETEGDADVDESEAATGYLTVYAAASKSCSTSIVAPLAEQLIAEMSCIKPGTLERLETSDKIKLEPEVFPYLQPEAVRALNAALTKYGKPVTINSALRTLPQQYLLKRWDVRNRCGVHMAASVGESNHEAGLSLDVDTGAGATANRQIRAALQAEGFVWLGAHDPVHYDFKGGDANLLGTSVFAFKRLWNRNHPEAPLTLDETYDAKTEAKLKLAPAAGFAIGARCEEP
jgi:hypothetical protein